MKHMNNQERKAKKVLFEIILGGFLESKVLDI